MSYNPSKITHWTRGGTAAAPHFPYDHRTINEVDYMRRRGLDECMVCCKRLRIGAECKLHKDW